MPFINKVPHHFITLFLKENCFSFKVTRAVKKPEEEPKPEKEPKAPPKPLEKIKKPEGTTKIRLP